LITVVTGPPCGGKSTYIRERAAGDDIVVDMDRLALALSVEGVQPFEYGLRVREVARAARYGAVKKALAVAQGERYLGLWIIDTDPSNDMRSLYRANGAHFVEVNPGRDVCLTRLLSRPVENHAVARKAIEEYFAKR
jgi:hypothetical protein